MNRADHATLAWTLVELAKPYLWHSPRIELRVQIGAGDHEVVIRDLIGVFANPYRGSAAPSRTAMDVDARVCRLRRRIRPPAPLNAAGGRAFPAGARPADEHRVRNVIC
jgi:hypothetical protein